MELNEYQKLASKTAVYPTLGHSVVYPTLGLTGEAGEVAEKIKKLFRDQNGIVTEEFIDGIVKELGDVLWYVAAIASEFNLTLGYIGQTNINKLSARVQNNTLRGSGDNR